MNEAGHTVIKNGPYNLVIMRHHQPKLFRDVQMIDPRFEFMNVPMPTKKDPVTGENVPIAKGNKFLGNATFSLPLVSIQGYPAGFLVCKRSSMFQGTGYWSDKPVGVVAPSNWGDYAQIMDRNGNDLTQTTVAEPTQAQVV